MPKIVSWSDNQAKAELFKRLSYAQNIRTRLERDWNETENILYNTRSSPNQGDINITYDTAAAIGTSEIDQSNSDYAINYTYKNYRFLCSQLAANPPAVIARPQSSDMADRSKADAADRLVRFFRTQYKLQEIFELAINNCQGYGTAIVKTIWDVEEGEPLDFDAETGEVLMTGDFSIVNVSPWHFYIDPDASTWDEVKWVYERVMMPYEEACYRFPDKKELLEKFRVRERRDDDRGNTSSLSKNYYDTVEMYQYWEKGMAHNGFVGRMCWCAKDGSLITPVRPNPFRFAPPKDKGLDLPEAEYEAKKDALSKAYLPYSVFTDGDIPGHVWGKATVLYSTPLQDLHNRLYNTVISCVQAHGIPRLILPEGTDIGEESITNSPWDVIRITGNQQPAFMEAMPLPAAVSELVTLTKQGIDDMNGVNDSMFGKQQREQSGFSMQYATNQGNMIRQRVFNKYRLFTEAIYKSLLNLTRKHWTEERTIYVLGKEKAFESMDISGADIDGGFDLVLEYGNSLSIDPAARREEIITLLPLFKEAGVDTRTILGFLKLNELDSAYDRVTMAADRQREIFSEMIEKNIYIPPRELQDQHNMLAYAYDYLMTAEYKYTAEEHKALIERHIKEREQLAAQAPQAGGAPAGAPGPAPQPGAAAPEPLKNTGVQSGGAAPSPTPKF